MKNFISLLSITFLLCITTIVKAENKKITFGKINIEDLKSTKSEIEAEASAEILYQYGYTSLAATAEGIKLETNVHVRIKIYKKEGFKYANIDIPTCQRYAKREKILNVKARMYQIENGEITKKRLSSGNIERKEINQNLTVNSLKFKNPKEGCIIEYKYKKSSDFIYALNTWNFQMEIPIKYNKFEIRIPEEVKFNREILGYEDINISKKQSTISGTGVLDNMGKPGYFSPVSEGDINQMRKSDYKETKITDYTYVAEKIKAFKNHKHVMCPKDHIARIEFSMENKDIHFITKESTDNLTNIYKKLNDCAEFGNALNRKAIMNKLLPSIINDSKSEKEKIARIYYYVKNNINWNGKYSLLKKHSFSHIKRKQTGNSAEVNLFLTTMLKTAGFNSCPVIVSTRDNGKVDINKAQISKFNHCICRVINQQDTMLLDATNPVLPMSLLPYNIQNCQGVAITENGPEKATIYKPTMSCKQISINAKLNKKGQIEGKFKESFSNYCAYYFRINSNNTEKRLNEIRNNNKTTSIKDYKTNNLLELYKKPEESFHFTMGRKTKHSVSLALKDIFTLIDQRPEYNLKNRKQPIDFPFSYYTNVTIEISLPENCNPTSIPESFSKEIDDSRYAFAINILYKDNKLIINYRDINKTMCMYPSSFSELNELQHCLTNKLSEKIILQIP